MLWLLGAADADADVFDLPLFDVVLARALKGGVNAFHLDVGVGFALNCACDSAQQSIVDLFIWIEGETCV